MSIIEEFSKNVGKDWEELRKAENLTSEHIQTIKSQFADIPISSSDTSLVVFGSIARNECTSGSDIDWTLLVDGQTNPNQLNLSHIIQEKLEITELAQPGQTGMFGQMTFSHDLIHYIGGQDDTNHNLSRRILLLLESQSILDSSENGNARDRVISGVIGKYIHNDSGYAATSDKENVPRFLLNDIIRFWRTMCVDFAYKQIEQQGIKWALRNIKLRMSRRLIFVKGLLMCARMHNTKLNQNEIASSLRAFSSIKPLDFLVETCLDYGIDQNIIITILDSYDNYLKMLNDKTARDHLKSLDMYAAYGDPIFEEARQNSHAFQGALNEIFLKDNNAISKFTIKYGVF